MSKSFFKHYSSEILDLLKLDNKTILKLEKVKNFLKIVKKK